MPNQFGFNLLGPDVACIDCEARGPMYVWTEKEQRKHHEAHVKEAAKVAARRKRQGARDARRLAAQKARENEVAYGERAP
jgi:hypothetical protein